MSGYQGMLCCWGRQSSLNQSNKRIRKKKKRNKEKKEREEKKGKGY